LESQNKWLNGMIAVIEIYHNFSPNISVILHPENVRDTKSVDTKITQEKHTNTQCTTHHNSVNDMAQKMNNH